MQTQKPNIVTRTWYRLTDKEDTIHIRDALSKATKMVEDFKDLLRARKEITKALTKLTTAPYNSPKGGSPFRIITHWQNEGFTCFFKRGFRDKETKQKICDLKKEIECIAPAWVIVPSNDWYFKVLPPDLCR